VSAASSRQCGNVGFRTGARHHLFLASPPILLPHFPFLHSQRPLTHKKNSGNIPCITILPMTIPPNDAFTLTSHSDSTPSLRSSRSRSLTRSPSPKIAFTTTQHVSNPDSKRRPSRRQRKSSGIVLSDSKKLADVDEALERALNANGHANGIVHQDETTSPTRKAKKIDWEIPRKALHSSIGMSCDFHDSISGTC